MSNVIKGFAAGLLVFLIVAAVFGLLVLTLAPMAVWGGWGIPVTVALWFGIGGALYATDEARD